MQLIKTLEGKKMYRTETYAIPIQLLAVIANADIVTLQF